MLMALILAIASLGIYSLDNNLFDLYMLVFFGAVGYVLYRLQVPAPPMILGLVLGKIMEQSFRQAMTISDMDPIIFVSSGICMTLLVCSILSILVSMITRRKKLAGDEVD
jgi:putative tricarboxylic transport membrane protein